MFELLTRSRPSPSPPPTHARQAIPVCGIRVDAHPGWTAILLRGELDLDARERLAREAAAALARGRPVLIELAGLDFADVGGVRVLRALVEDGARGRPPVPVELHGARGQVADLFASLGWEFLLRPSGGRGGQS